MKTIFSYKKGAYKFSDKEREILMLLIEYFKHAIPDGNGSFLSMLELDKIDFMWSPAMKDTDVFGAWVMLFKDLVFIRPADDFSNVGGKHVDMFPSLRLDQDLLKFTLYLLESNGMMLSTIFHELYHKWQYRMTGILYIFNCLVFMLTGYEFSTKSKFSIEGDVRIYIDNEVLHDAIGKFYEKLYRYLWIKNRLNMVAGEDYTDELAELENDNAIMTIVNKLQNLS